MNVPSRVWVPATLGRVGDTVKVVPSKVIQPGKADPAPVLSSYVIELEA